MQQGTAQAMTKQSWEEVSRLLQIKIAPYALKEYARSFRLLMEFADRANPELSADAGEWANAMYAQLKQHLLDSNPRLFFWEPDKTPPMVRKVFEPKQRVSHIVEIEQVEKEAAEHKVQVEHKQAQERAKNDCEHEIARFFPTRGAHLAYDVQERVQKTLREHLAKQIEKGADMVGVLRKIREFIDAEYKKLAPSERL